MQKKRAVDETALKGYISGKHTACLKLMFRTIVQKMGPFSPNFKIIQEVNASEKIMLFSSLFAIS